MGIRRTGFTKEIITADEMCTPCEKITRVVAIAVVGNPFADIYQPDLSPLFDIGAQFGQSLTEEPVNMLGEPPACYDKAALAGSSGAMAHGAAVMHPALGKPVGGCWRRQVPDAIQPQVRAFGRVH